MATSDTAFSRLRHLNLHLHVGANSRINTAAAAMLQCTPSLNSITFVFGDIGASDGPDPNRAEAFTYIVTSQLGCFTSSPPSSHQFRSVRFETSIDPAAASSFDGLSMTGLQKLEAHPFLVPWQSGVKSLVELICVDRGIERLLDENLNLKSQQCVEEVVTESPSLRIVRVRSEWSSPALVVACERRGVYLEVY